MRKVIQTQFGGPEVLQVVEAPTPQPGPGEVRIAVRAVGINPVDAVVRSGLFPLLGDPPFGLGWDIAGVVDAVGPDVTDLVVGDRVFGMLHFPGEAAGAAEFVTAPATQVARTPDTVDDVHAAALPLVGLTAYDALVNAGEVTAGTRVAVLGGGGGVGHVAVQMAVALGADVVATASADKAEFVRALGASVVDRAAPWESIEPVDVAIDPFGGDISHHLLGRVRDGGLMAVLVGRLSDELRAAAEVRSIRLVRIEVEPDQAGLARLAQWLGDGGIRPYVQHVLPLDHAGRAHALLEAGHTRGKIVLAV